MSSIIELRGVSKSFGSFRAVDGVSLAIDEGQFVTLLGASGSGKTTTLRLIAGLETPGEGSIHFAGEDITDVPPTHRDMRLVFQDFALFPNLTVFDNVAFGLRLRIARSRFARSEIDARVKRFLDMVHLGDQAKKMPDQLSGGQKQRVALARALVTEPRVVLFDEPLGSLDANLRKSMQVELKRMHRELGRTFIYVTHDQDEAMTMSDRIAVMQSAKLLQIGSPEDIYLRPDSAAVARFVGAANVLDAVLERADGADASLRLKSGVALRAPLNGVGGSAGMPAPGASMHVMMRAEHFIFDRREVSGGVNWFSGRVLERMFLGRSIEYQVMLGGAGDVMSILDQTQRLAVAPRDGILEFGIKLEHVRLLTT